MFADVEGVRRLTFMDEWNEIAGFAKIEAILDKWAVRRYVTKYVLKDGEIELGGALSKSARMLLNQIPSKVPAQPSLKFNKGVVAGVQ